MSLAESLARAEHGVRPLLNLLSPAAAVKVFSKGRPFFIDRLAQELPAQRVIDRSVAVTAWNLTFRTPLWNAAGMFKKGEAYDVMAMQGAGAWVAGTTTATPRTGNERAGVRWPVATYPASHAGSNWLGLPNPGHDVVAKRIATLRRVNGCNIGASVSADPGREDLVALNELVDGMRAYDAAKVDYIELNESCPNVEERVEGRLLDDALIDRLEHVSQAFLRRRTRALPVVVKFSNDTNPAQVPDLLDVLLTLGFDGVIFGNTSTRYEHYAPQIASSERKVFEHFTSTFGGGVSGRPLKNASRDLSAAAARALASRTVPHEFHVIRCGGVESPDDLAVSRHHGVTLHQWYTGYFEAFARDGHNVYQRFFDTLS